MAVGPDNLTMEVGVTEFGKKMADLVGSSRLAHNETLLIRRKDKEKEIFG